MKGGRFSRGLHATAVLPALLAATSPDARGARLYGPSGLGNLSGAPAEQTVYSRLRSEDDTNRIWQSSEELTGTSFPVALSMTDPRGGR
ncbi:hypothetical protein GCM10023194_07120 [Planotetraspora phitsanulokensis]|uniref:Uncharacterized protein n=1 Tax=Planotetraspora phitsanulokensis TaxID=575192 RepID=A0A8J3U5V5_9ACTN|nr:hypothetical protein [Planotetraspora phitsanulokensis]GII39208.1 hypothetical protein Pph01_42110 [Planotetraspora phitsanulokensis]